MMYIASYGRANRWKQGDQPPRTRRLSVQYPYYHHADKARMYTVGSLFYAIYFWVSFPAFYMMDENPRAKKWTVGRAAWDALAAGMLVTILLDLWRVVIGPIFYNRDGAAEGGLPFLNGKL
jgi:cycloeucalenol cycloisomerase